MTEDAASCAAALHFGNAERGVMIFWRCLIIALVLAYCAPAMAQNASTSKHPCGHGNQPACPPPPPPPPPPPAPTLTLTFSPQMPSVPANAPLGTVVATATAAWSDGSAFTGTLAFGGTGTNGDDGGTFALSCMQCARANIVINPAGLGIMGDGGSVQNITVTATQ